MLFLQYLPEKGIYKMTGLTWFVIFQSLVEEAHAFTYSFAYIDAYRILTNQERRRVEMDATDFGLQA